MDKLIRCWEEYLNKLVRQDKTILYLPKYGILLILQSILEELLIENTLKKI